MKDAYINELQRSKEYFDRSTRCLEEPHSGHSPVDGTMTVAQQVAHVAQTVDWFLEGVTSDKGFSMDFEANAKKILSVTSLGAAREWLDKSYATAIEYFEKTPMEELTKPVTEGALMVGMPRFGIAPSIVEHIAHHRGALTVYSRALGLTPAMPYMEDMPA